ncbi:MAG: YvcK family protein [Candidatus Pacearchaeota archaeon]|nr:YvcK family protein [Candidatus Pacearchaeota archaeon]
MQKIVTIGGGTGHFQILRGLKNYECDITSIVNVSDDGGSSGRLQDEYGILPPGDARQCMVALADDNEAKLLRDLFSFRLKDGHNLGNLIITALASISGSSAQAIKEAGKLLRIKGKVLPVSTDEVVLHAETGDGMFLQGQTEISYPRDKNTKIKEIFHVPEAYLYKEAGDAIRNADKIVICPGELYGSILSNFIVKGMREALQESKATIIYVCNLFTKEGTYNFKASDFVREIEKYSGVEIDYIIVNVGKPSQDVLQKYLGENSQLVEDDLGDDERVVRGNYVSEYPSMERTILRHVPEKIAREIISLN